MTRPIEEIYGDLSAGLDSVEREALAALALRLEAETPRPAPGFRGALRASLLRTLGGTNAVTTPPAARTLALSYAAVGLLLLLVAAAGVLDAGPFAQG